MGDKGGFFGNKMDFWGLKRGFLGMEGEFLGIKWDFGDEVEFLGTKVEFWVFGEGESPRGTIKKKGGFGISQKSQNLGGKDPESAEPGFALNKDGGEASSAFSALNKDGRNATSAQSAHNQDGAAHNQDGVARNQDGAAHNKNGARRLLNDCLALYQDGASAFTPFPLRFALIGRALPALQSDWLRAWKWAWPPHMVAMAGGGGGGVSGVRGRGSLRGFPQNLEGPGG